MNVFFSKGRMNNHYIVIKRYFQLQIRCKNSDEFDLQICCYLRWNLYAIVINGEDIAMVKSIANSLQKSIYNGFVTGLTVAKTDFSSNEYRRLWLFELR